ncbi:hypothetical protein J2X14_000527 [Pantoea alhagi]|uniref:hypothetical protein n=1 Tax=Mixta sp. BE291 TaxID=3158787 RepID=UPI0028573CD8|nr:hypothetical protein [Pantoea alhagi]HCQ8226506.1 hypothetical protein [Klebsiella variicola]
MGNFLGEIGKRVGDLVSHPVKISKDLVTDPSKGWDELTDLYTHNEHKDQDLFQKGFGIKGWVGDHPQETAAAVVASIFGGWAAGGAYAGGAAGGTGAASAGAGTGSAAGMTGIGAGSVSATPFSAAGSSLAYAPSSSSVLAGTGSQGIASGAGTSALSYAPTQSTVLGGTGSGIAPDFSAGLSSSGSSGINPQLIQQGISRLQQSQNQNQQQQAPQITLHTKSGSFNYQPPSSTAYSQAQQLLNQALGTNQFSTNPFRR